MLQLGSMLAANALGCIICHKQHVLLLLEPTVTYFCLCRTSSEIVAGFAKHILLYLSVCQMPAEPLWHTKAETYQVQDLTQP